MKTTGIKIAALSVLLILGAVSALANGKNLKGSISVSTEARVNNTKLKPGVYGVTFNAETSELSISDANRVIATVKVSVRSADEKPKQTLAYISNTDKGAVLSKVVFKGDDRAIILDESAVASK